MPNLIWPRALSPDVGPSCRIGRTIHWLGVALAVAFLVTALGFAADGWSRSEAVGLATAAIALALAARGVRYILAKE